MDDKFCYVTVSGQRDDEGIIPSIVKEGVKGHFPMMGKDGKSPWHWGKTFSEAEATCKFMNKKLGLTEDEVERMVAASMMKS